MIKTNPSLIKTIKTDFKVMEKNHLLIETFSHGDGAVAKHFPPTVNQS